MGYPPRARTPWTNVWGDTAGLERALDPLTPREIQARIRSGATPEELAEASGMPLAGVERYAGPPMAERYWAAERARACHIRPGDRSLQTIMELEAAARGIPADRVTWDAWRRADGRWMILVGFDQDSSAPAAAWIYDARSGSVVAEDEPAQRLANEDVVIPFHGGRRHHTEVIPLSDDPMSDDPVSDDDKAVEGPSEDLGHETPSAIEPEQTVIDLPTQAEPVKPAKRGRRASVPSWDEILFGSNQSDA